MKTCFIGGTYLKLSRKILPNSKVFLAVSDSNAYCGLTPGEVGTLLKYSASEQQSIVMVKNEKTSKVESCNVKHLMDHEGDSTESENNYSSHTINKGVNMVYYYIYCIAFFILLYSF